jgi:hypothetical protein
MTIFAFAATVALVAAGTMVTAYRAAAHHAAPRAATVHSQAPSAHGTPQPAVGSDAVAIAPAVARQADARQVAALLKTYFGSINSRNYLVYSHLFIPQMRESAQHFSAGYRSTIDSGAALAGLSAASGQRLAATVTFTSHQNPADSPDDAACDRWGVVMWLTVADGGYLITRSPATLPPSVQACA